MVKKSIQTIFLFAFLLGFIQPVNAAGRTFASFNDCVDMNYMPQMSAQLDKMSRQNAYITCSKKLPSFAEQSKMKKSASNYRDCIKARYMPQLDAAVDAASKQNAYLQCSNLRPAG